MPKFDPYFPFWYRAVKRLGFRHAAWTLRKLALPVAKGDLVLEVGAGDHPFPRSDILVDKYEDSDEQERWGSLPLDRPTFIFEGEHLPFRDQAFDFVIAVQVLEHSGDPGRFLQELQRVGKGGYIEVPEAIWERLAPMPFHLSEITERDGTLMIKKKHAWSEDEEVEELWKRKLMWTKPVRELARKNPDLLNVHYFWKDSIDFTVTNPRLPSFVAPPWEHVKNREVERQSAPPKGMALFRLKTTRITKKWIEKFISACYAVRRKEPDYASLMRCTRCESTRFVVKSGLFICMNCKSTYTRSGNCIKPTRASPHSEQIEKESALRRGLAVPDLQDDATG